jgi:hypothetical protein
MSTCLAFLCVSPHGQAMAVRPAVRRDGLLGLFFFFRGFTRPCCCGGSRGCWIGLVIDWMKFASATSRAVWPPSSGKGGEVCPCLTMSMQGSALAAAPEPRRGVWTRSADAWCTRNPGETTPHQPEPRRPLQGRLCQFCILELAHRMMHQSPVWG